MVRADRKWQQSVLRTHVVNGSFAKEVPRKLDETGILDKLTETVESFWHGRPFMAFQGSHSRVPCTSISDENYPDNDTEESV